MRQREFILGLLAAISCAARSSTSPTATATRSSPCTRTRSWRSRRHRTTCSPSSNSWNAMPAAEGGHDRTNMNPLAPARLPHRLPDRPAAHLELLGFCGPTGNTYGSTHRRLPWRARQRRRCCWLATAASCRTCCCGAPRSSATSASATASCRAAASCRRSATRSRSSTRAHQQQGAGQRRPSS